MEEITVGIIEADVHAAFNTEENQSPGRSCRGLTRSPICSSSRVVMRSIGRLKRSLSVRQTNPEQSTPLLLRPAPLVGRSLPGMHLIVQRGDHRDQIVRTSVDGRVATLGGGFMRFR